MNQDATLYDGRPRPGQHCVRWWPKWVPTKWHLDPSIQPFGHNRHWLKIGGTVPLLSERSPHLRQCGRGQGLPPRQVSSWSIKPFDHNTPTLQTGQDRQDRQQSDSIGWAVLQTVAQLDSMGWFSHQHSGTCPQWTALDKNAAQGPRSRGRLRSWWWNDESQGLKRHCIGTGGKVKRLVEEV